MLPQTRLKRLKAAFRASGDPSISTRSSAKPPRPAKKVAPRRSAGKQSLCLSTHRNGKPRFEKSAMRMQNSSRTINMVGPKTQPCLTPLSTLNQASPPITFPFGFSWIAATSSNRSAGTPIHSRHSNIAPRGGESKAFAKSTKTA